MPGTDLSKACMHRRLVALGLAAILALFSTAVARAQQPSPFTSTSRNISANALIVKSLTGHWSAALLVNSSVSTFLNYDLRAGMPRCGVQHLPYSQSRRRMFTLQYSVGLISNDYIEEPIFNKTAERLVDHRLITQLSMRQS